MDKKLYRKILKDYNSIGGNVLTFCQHSEIFALKDSLEYIKIALSEGMEMYFVTNASCLYPKTLDKLLEWGFDGKFYVSFTGIREETYKKVMGLELKQSLENMLYLVKKAKKLIAFVRCFEHDLAPGEKEEVFLFWRDKGVNVEFRQPHSWSGLLKEAPFYLVRERKKGCTYPLNQMCVDVDGKGYLCCKDIEKTYIIGNLIDSSITELWNNHKYNYVLNQLFSKEIVDKTLICNKC